MRKTTLKGEVPRFWKTLFGEKVPAKWQTVYCRFERVTQAIRKSYLREGGVACDSAVHGPRYSIPSPLRMCVSCSPAISFLDQPKQDSSYKHP